MKRISELLAPLFTKAGATENQSSGNSGESSFIQKEKLKKRKCVYVRTETHDIITKIVKANQDSTMTVGDLVDSILMEYLSTNRDKIGKNG